MATDHARSNAAKPVSVLIAEDDPRSGESLKRFLVGRGFEVEWAPNGQLAWEALQARSFDLLITDIRMPELDGIELTRRAHGHDPTLAIIVTTAHATIEGTVRALQQGALDYVPKPFAHDHMAKVVERVLGGAVDEKPGPSKRVPKGRARLPELFLGSNEPMKEAVELADRVAASDSIVLLRGETGTGKELLARRIHARSNRSALPFVRFNCGSLSPTLGDSQLFGSEKGAYTSSVRQTIGVIESAEGGTVFLDEIGELPGELQVRLLDFLQDRSFRRVGSSTLQHADVRILLATNRDLEDMVRHRAFRKDLYYRIRQIQIVIPPLRERVEDLGGLARDILERECPDSVPTLGEELVDLARAYPWPGNVRELQQSLIAAHAMAAGSTIRVEHLQAALGLGTMSSPETGLDASETPPADASMEDIERWHIRRAVKAHDGNVSAAARSLGINRSTIYRRLLRD